MRFTHEEIKKDLLDNWEALEQHPEPIDLVNEYAEGYCGVYYSETLADWVEMPNEYCDRWQEFTPDANGKTIFDLMAIDVWNYYNETAHAIYSELLKEKEASK